MCEYDEDDPGLINERLKLFLRPPDDFDPRADDADMERYGLPLRPDPETEPQRHAFWWETFKNRPSIYGLPPELKPNEIVLAPFFRLPLETLDQKVISTRSARAALRSRNQTSGNWSGTYVNPRDGTIFDEVHAAWIAPTVKVGRPTGVPFLVSIWIGLDGQRRYYQSSLPQVGTAHAIDPNDPTTAVHFAWVQWWDRHDDPDAPAILPVPVAAGDMMRCTLVVRPDRQAVRCFVLNQTQNIGMAVEISPPDRDPELFVSGATAQWVTERPSIYPTKRPYAFPNYGSIEMDECLAVAGRDDGTNETRNLAGGRIISMTDWRPGPSRKVVISAAKRATDVEARSSKTRYRKA